MFLNTTIYEQLNDSCHLFRGDMSGNKQNIFHLNLEGTRFVDEHLPVL